MDSNKSTENKGLGFMSVLTLIFVIAKLFEVISWSWWLVFAPTLFSIGLTLVILLVAAVIVAVRDR